MSRRRGRGGPGAAASPSAPSQQPPPPATASASSTAPLLHGAHIVGYTFLNNRLFYADALAALALHDVVRVRPVFDEGELGDVLLVNATAGVTTVADVLNECATRCGLSSAQAAFFKAYSGESPDDETGPRDPIGGTRFRDVSVPVPLDLLRSPTRAILVDIPLAKGMSTTYHDAQSFHRQDCTGLCPRQG